VLTERSRSQKRNPIPFAVYNARRPLRYARSLFGIVDLLAIIPTYASIFAPGLHFLATILILRLLRLFRILNMVQFMGKETASGWL